MSLFKSSDVLCVNSNEPIFQVLQLDIGLLLHSVDLFLQNGNLLEELSPISLMLLGDTIDFRKQLFNLVILEPNHLPQAIELNTEDFLLILLIVLKILYIKVNHLLELVLHPLELLILLLHVIVIRLFPLDENTLKPADLLVLLFADLVHPLVDNVLDSLLLFERLFQLVDLVLHVFLALLVLGADLLLV